MSAKKQIELYHYKIEVVRVKDADTIEAKFDLGFSTTHTTAIRMLGYNAPEIFKPKSPEEKQAGLAAKDYLQQIITAQADNLYCESNSLDKYGRALGNVYYKDQTDAYVSVNDLMINFLATPSSTQV